MLGVMLGIMLGVMLGVMLHDALGVMLGDGLIVKPGRSLSSGGNDDTLRSLIQLQPVTWHIPPTLDVLPPNLAAPASNSRYLSFEPLQSSLSILEDGKRMESLQETTSAPVLEWHKNWARSDEACLIVWRSLSKGKRKHQTGSTQPAEELIEVFTR